MSEKVLETITAFEGMNIEIRQNNQVAAVSSKRDYDLEISIIDRIAKALRPNLSNGDIIGKYGEPTCTSIDPTLRVKSRTGGVANDPNITFKIHTAIEEVLALGETVLREHYEEPEVDAIFTGISGQINKSIVLQHA